MTESDSAHGSRVTGALPWHQTRTEVRGGPRRFTTPLVIFVVTRAALLMLVHVAPSLMPAPRMRRSPSVLPFSDPLYGAGSWSRPWFRFDARWFVDVAEHGYRWGSVAHTNTNFLPLFPACIRAVSVLVGGSSWIAGWLVANAAFLVALCLLWLWSEPILSSAQRVSFVLLVTVFPFGFFFATPYSESLFLACTAGAFLAAQRGQWHLATFAAGLAVLCRPTGVALVAALALIACIHGERRKAAFTLFALLPLALFAVYLGLRFGHPLGFLVNHTEGWLPPHGTLSATISEQFSTPLRPFDRVDAVCALLFTASAPLVWRRLGPGYAIYVLVGVALPLAHGLAGMERYVIVLFPAFAAATTVGGRWTQLVLFGCSVLGLVIASMMFATGYAIF